jgi:hypothetical protein
LSDDRGKGDALDQTCDHIAEQWIPAHTGSTTTAREAPC